MQLQLSNLPPARSVQQVNFAGNENDTEGDDQQDPDSTAHLQECMEAFHSEQEEDPELPIEYANACIITNPTESD